MKQHFTLSTILRHDLKKWKKSLELNYPMKKAFFEKYIFVSIAVVVVVVVVVAVVGAKFGLCFSLYSFPRMISTMTIELGVLQ